MLNQINELKRTTDLTINEANILTAAAVYHDIVCDPKRQDNEEKSIEFFKNTNIGVKFLMIPNFKKKVIEIIADTKKHTPTTFLSKIFCALDLSGFLSKNIEWNERLIFKEYQFVSTHVYKEKRVEFLTALKKRLEGTNDPVDDDNVYMQWCYDKICPQISSVIDYLSEKRYKIGLLCGSFNPFHIGHLDVLERAEKIFDKVIILVGHKPGKEENENKAYETIKEKSYRQVEKLEGKFIPHWISEKKEQNRDEYFVVRGMRNAIDAQQELDGYNLLNEFGIEVEEVIFPTPRRLLHVSSSFIRTLKEFPSENGPVPDYITNP